MAGAVVQSRTAQGSGSGPSLAFSGSVVANNLLVAGIGTWSNLGNNPITNNIASSNGTLTNRAVVSGATNVESRTAYGVATSSAAATISTTLGSTYDWRLSIVELSGITTVSPLDQSIDGTGSSATHASGNTAATTQANDTVLVWDTHGTSDTATVAAAAGYTKITNASDESSTNMPGMMFIKNVAATGAQSASVTWENGEYICTVMAFKDSGAAAATSLPPARRSQQHMIIR